MTLEMLADAWPAEYEKSHENSQKIKPDCLDASEESAPTVIPSLAELSLKPAVEEALWTNQTTEIEELLWMSHKTELIKANKIIDFSHFSLFPEGIVSMVSQFEAVEVLRLSHNPNVTIETVRRVLPALPCLRRLVLLNTCQRGPS